MRTVEVREPLSTSVEQNEVLISVRGASKRFCRTLNRSLRYMAFDAFQDLLGFRSASSLRPGEFWALRGVTFELRRGQSLGVMGLNGAGKSTLLKLILGSIRLTEGEVAISGRASMLSEHGLGFDPLLTGRENVYLASAVLEIDRRCVEQAFQEIVAFAELEDSIDSPVRGYSAGMRARLGFSVAMHLEPEILLVDEVLAVGDIGFQRRCIQHAQRYLQRGGSLVLVSHNPHLVQLLCDRCIVLDHGMVTWDGDAVGGVAQYLRAAHTASDDPVAVDAALTGAPAAVPKISGEAVEIHDYGMQPVDGFALYTGEAARVRVRYAAARSLEVRWGFSLLSSDLATAITSEGLMEPFSIPAGRGEFVAAIPRLPLVPGRYALRVAILDPDTEMPYALGGFHSPPRYFTVKAPVTRRNNYRMYTRDLVVLEDLEWERHELDDADAASSA
jgi:lipopolysaccharide transport system ATP-binding protein